MFDKVENIFPHYNYIQLVSCTIIPHHQIYTVNPALKIDCLVVADVLEWSSQHVLDEVPDATTTFTTATYLIVQQCKVCEEVLK